MTLIGGRKHPRRPLWDWVQCNGCLEDFWSDGDLAIGGKNPKHYCERCWPRPGKVDPPTHKRDLGAEHDREYNGDRFTNGEW